MTRLSPRSAFDVFRDSLGAPAQAMAHLHHDIVGQNATVSGPFGAKPLVYADYVASGRALMCVEQFVLQQVLPWYANSHTETSYCGAMMTRLREEARHIIGQLIGATEAQHAVVFAGSGCTTALNRIVHLLGVRDSVARGEEPVVFIGPYEHHSNILPWRETGAMVIEIGEANGGGPDTQQLHHLLRRYADRPIFGSFSAASNVTGIVTDVVQITRMLKAAGARVVWDYAGGGPYLPIDMTPAADAAIDAIALSPHKFLGGPGASGVFAIRRDAVRNDIPAVPGGGTVRFVSPWGHDYNTNVEGREEGGTPNIVGDIRAALVFIVKNHIGEAALQERHVQLVSRAFAVWKAVPEIELLGNTDCPRLPFFSFRVRDGKSGYVHQQVVTRMLSDFYGIQARGGCACAGPYGHRLLHIDREASDALRASVLAGHEASKLGFTRLNLSALLSDAEADFIIASVASLAREASALSSNYSVEDHTAMVLAHGAPARGPSCTRRSSSA